MALAGSAFTCSTNSPSAGRSMPLSSAGASRVVVSFMAFLLVGPDGSRKGGSDGVEPVDQRGRERGEAAAEPRMRHPRAEERPARGLVLLVEQRRMLGRGQGAADAPFE